jgi:WD40 repeat protein
LTVVLTMRLGLAVVLIPFALETPAPAGDAPGEPLPAGATARLGTGAPVQALAVAPDGTAVAVARGPAVGLFRLTGAELRTLRGHRKPVLHVAYAPQGELLASAAGPGDPGPLRLWDPDSGKLLHRWGDAGRTVRDLTFAADGQTIALLEPAGVTLHNARSGRFTGSLPWPEGVSECCRLAVSPDGRTLVAGCEKAERIVWELPARRLVRCEPAPGPCRGLHFLADGRRLLWLDADDLRIWTLAADDTPAFAGRYLRNVTALALARDGQALAVAQGEDLTVWDVRDRRLLKRLDGHRAAIRALAFTPDGRSLVAGDEAGAALVWDLTR